LPHKDGHLTKVASMVERVQQAGLHISPDVLAALRRLPGEDR